MSETNIVVPRASMTRRRFLYTTGAGIAGVLLAAACGDSSDGTTTTGPAATTAGASGNGPLKVGFAYVGPVADLGWTWSHDNARKAVEGAFPNVETTFIENVPFSEEATRIMNQLAVDGHELIFVNSEFADFTVAAAEGNPGTQFVECSGHSFRPNLQPFMSKLWEASYLMGVAAGRLTKSNILGYVVAFPVPIQFNDTMAFALGARSVNPDAVVQTVTVNSWFDPQLETQAAISLVDAGADFLYGPQDDGAVVEVAEQRGVWAGAQNADRSEFAPNWYVNSAALNWNDFYVSTTQSVIDATYAAADSPILLPLGSGVDLGNWGPQVPSEVQDEVAAVRAEIIAGSSPFVGPLLDEEGAIRVPDGERLSDLDIYNMTWTGQGVAGLASAN